MWAQILSMAFALFLLMDSIGNIPLYISILKNIKPRRQRIIIIRELVIALIIMVVFALLGDKLLSFLHVTMPTILISGGIILFLIAIKMIFPVKRDPDLDHPKEIEPFIVPLAIPFVAGPAVLAAIMLYAGQQPNPFVPLAALFIAWIASTLILLGSSLFARLLGWRGIVALERLMGLILTLIAVQMFLEGINSFIQS